MKSLGVKQFQQMKFELLPLPEKFKGILGSVPKAFMAIIYGNSGNGKTEFCIQLARGLADLGKVAWLSYEQGHGYDLQMAVNRNKMEEVSGNFIPIDPVANLPDGVTFLQDLDNYLKKRNSPDFIFIDSVDYTGFTWEEYVYLKKKYGKKKSFIWISHATGKEPKKSIGRQIEYDGGIGIFVNKYIAQVNKNRFGGFESYVIYEERARLLNPLFFEKKDKDADKGKGKSKTPPSQPSLFDQKEPPNEQGKVPDMIAEAWGVHANWKEDEV